MKGLIKMMLVVLAFGCLSSGCRREISLTVIQVPDSVRHYYAIKQGQQLDITFKLKNVGEEPLFLEDIQPSCGCIVIDQDAERMVPAGGETSIRLTYNSNKNVGYVEQNIYLYGNIYPEGQALLIFDINVVPDADYTRDYEELYRDFTASSSVVDDVVDGSTSKKGYYTDSTFYVRKNRDTPEILE